MNQPFTQDAGMLGNQNTLEIARLRALEQAVAVHLKALERVPLQNGAIVTTAKEFEEFLTRPTDPSAT